MLLRGVIVTVELTIVTAVLGIGLGILGAAASFSRHSAIRAAAATYVEVVRNIPFIVLMFFIFFGLPSAGIRLSAFTAAVAALTVNLSAYATEIVRAGLISVHRGQREGGLALGVSKRDVFTLITLPQALANMYPALASQIVITMFDSAVVSQIAVTDLTHMANLIESKTFRAFETYLTITVIYLLLSIMLRRLANLLGRRLQAGRAA